jgi:hypothetical protein|tara:strand:+ start:99 stop:248 length:150 start_codon:yes stop_codon:yes gene_type:complete
LFEEKTQLFYCFPSKNPQLADPPQWFDTLRGEISGVLPQKQWNWDVVIL